MLALTQFPVMLTRLQSSVFPDQILQSSMFVTGTRPSKELDILISAEGQSVISKYMTLYTL